MRYLASEKLEIIQLVEQSHLPVLRTLEKLGIPRQTFYLWYDRYLTGGLTGSAHMRVAARCRYLRSCETSRFMALLGEEDVFDDPERSGELNAG
jgi:transposase-like protein